MAKEKKEAECPSPADMDELLKTARRTGTAVLPHIASFHRLASRIVSASSFRSSHRSHRGVRAFTHRPAHDVLHRAVIIIITITITSSPSPSLSSSPPANHAFAMPIDEPSPPRQLTDNARKRAGKNGAYRNLPARLRIG